MDNDNLIPFDRTKSPVKPEGPQDKQEPPALSYPDDVPIGLADLEEIQRASRSIDQILDLFEKSPDKTLREAAATLGPAAERLRCTIANDFPDLSLIRELLEKKGVSIRG